MDTKALPQLAWLSELKTRPHTLLVAGAGYVAPGMEMSGHAYATLSELLEGSKPGWAVRSSAMLAVRCGNALRYVLLRAGAEDPSDPGKWRFPAAYCLQRELPLKAAARALRSELAVTGHLSDWRSAEVEVAGKSFTYLMDCALLESTARYLLVRNTLEFFYPVTVQAPLWSALQISDAAGYGRGVQLFRRETLLEMADRGELSQATARVCEITQGQEPAAVNSDFNLPPQMNSDLLPLWEGAAVKSR